jgi:tetratricopeptide (TPR) repeat protein
MATEHACSELRALASRGVARFGQGDLAGARRDFDAVLMQGDEASPVVATARVLRAAIRHNAGDLGGALADAERVLALRPTWTNALVVRSRVLARKGDVARAIRDLDVACAAHPGDAKGFVHRGCMLAVLMGRCSRAGRGVPAFLIAKLRDAAMADLARALRLDPRCERARAELAALLRAPARDAA